jgi:ubiquinone/menaquinone biosynthesis C-methylase UbiE
MFTKYYRQPDEKIVRYYVSPKVKLILKYVNISNNWKILDVGCGNGTFSYYLDKEANIVCTDFSRSLIKKNPCKNKAIIADANYLPILENTFDLVFEANMLHHIKNLNQVLKEIARVSKKYIVIIEPNMWNLPIFVYSLLSKQDRGAIFLTVKKIRDILKNNNYNVIRVIRTGMIYQNTTPDFLLNILKIFDFNFYFGVYKIIICEKMED